MSEQFSWTKFFKGIVDPTAYFKTMAILIRVCIVALVIVGVYAACVRIHSMLVPKKQEPSEFHVVGQQGGEVRNSADQKQTKFGLLNF